MKCVLLLFSSVVVVVVGDHINHKNSTQRHTYAQRQFEAYKQWTMMIWPQPGTENETSGEATHYHRRQEQQQPEQRMIW
uniref:Putative secreted protein n=1 Tax=Anopheles marajoara TaxID=58244 RepID=A0A2M4CC17_9DIPT